MTLSSVVPVILTNTVTLFSFLPHHTISQLVLSIPLWRPGRGIGIDCPGPLPCYTWRWRLFSSVCWGLSLIYENKALYYTISLIGCFLVLWLNITLCSLLSIVIIAIWHITIVFMHILEGCMYIYVRVEICLQNTDKFLFCEKILGAWNK